MRKYHLCGLGNALLDIQQDVNDSDLEKFRLRKGEMKLVSIEEQNEILSTVSKSKPNICSGGSAANTVIAFAQFGGKASYMTSLGNDENGKYYAKEFRELGINLQASFLEEKTGTCLVLITPDSERTMNTCLGASAMFSPEMVNDEIIKESEWLYLEGYKLTAELSKNALFKAIEAAKKHNTKIAFTFSDVFVVQYFNEDLKEVVNNSDLIFCNEAEAMAFTGAENSDIAFNEICKIVPNVAMTLGSKGSKLRWSGRDYFIPPYEANPVDSTGAGDMFAGAFMYGIISTDNAIYAGHLGSYSAAKIVSQMGARLNGDYHSMKTEIRNKISLTH